MKKTILFLSLIAFIGFMFVGCENKAPMSPSADQVEAKQTEQLTMEAQKQVGMPAISNFQEKKTLKWIYELCDQADLMCHAYLFNEFKGEVGQYLGRCIGYGVPYSTQFSNPEILGFVDGGEYGARNPYNKPQAEPNGLFKPEGMSATWLIMINPETGEPTPMYVEPTIIVSQFKLH